MGDWFIYMVECADQSLYTGITTDPDRRLAEHNSSKSTTRYTRARQPVTLVYKETADSRAAASKREIAIKKLSRRQKLALLAR